MTDDTRVTCIGCGNRQRVHTGVMACMQPKRAGLKFSPRNVHVELGSALAELPQRCPAHVPRLAPKAKP